LDRRNLVLDAMVETGAVTRAQAASAKAAPLKLAAPNVEASDAPYFIDLVKDHLLARYSERDLAENSYRIYTTLDPDLQRAAAEAVQVGLKRIDEQITRMRTRRVRVGQGRNARTEVQVAEGPMAQVALIAMNPGTGEILALVGGRNYGLSQLNHAVAQRPTGSVFKPFVYATAINSALSADISGAPPWTPASVIDDAPTTFTYGDQIYEPRNYKDEYHGNVSARFALAHSLNNATVRLAEEVGYENVATLARAAGLMSVQPTPAMALGAYDATPLDVAAAYTVFANGGTRISPVLVGSLRDANGDSIETFHADRTPVLDPRVAYVMTSMMEGVMNNGTGYAVRAMGFMAPAAGKTGTSHDGWFSGYTSNLLCVVWVGFDDYSDLRLSGAVTAAPIWGEFMTRALNLPQYSDAKAFEPPPGTVQVQLDKVTNRLATASCPDVYSVAFIGGTEPRETCDQLPGDRRGILSRILGIGEASPPPPAPMPASRSIGLGKPSAAPSAPQARTQTAPAAAEEPKKKKGFFGKILGIFKDEAPKKPESSPQGR
jgi:penicillin-binding protein 1B